MEHKKITTSRGSFPNAVDFVAMAAWVFVAQVAAVFLASAFGIEIPGMGLVDSADDEQSLWAQLSMAESLAVIYPIAMTLSIAGILLYRKARGGTGKIARFSAAGLNPTLILAGIVWIVAVQIAMEPLMALLPDVPNVVGRGFFAILTAVVLAPLFEELLCRGIILESFRARRGVIAAWFWSSVFFALIHGQITSMVNALVAGSILGFIYIKSRSIFSAVILHGLNNGLALAAIAFGYGESTFSEIITDPKIYGGLYIASALLALTGFGIMARQLRAERRREKYPVQE